MEDFEMIEVKPASTVFTRYIVQKLPLTLVFAYMSYHEDIKQLLNLLCKGS